MTRKNDCELLPHVKENIYGFDRNSAQIYGWEIQKFNIMNEWTFSKGEKVKIGVIDTGCDLYHEDIKDNLLQGKNLLNPKKDPIDDNGHGTHVSGTIAAKDNGLGIVGVAPMAKIIPIKALNSIGNGNNSVIADAIIWATDNKCDFITMSLGSPYDSIEIRKAIQYAKSKNVLLFCAAGNSGKEIDIMYPAKYEDTIAIGSVNQNLTRSNFTCAGPSLDLLSPGENILGCSPNNSYTIMSGTSMANPFAVGCAALILSYARKIGYKKLYSKQQYMDFFKKTSIKLSDKKFRDKKYQGYGIIQPSCKLLKNG